VLVQMAGMRVAAPMKELRPGEELRRIVRADRPLAVAEGTSRVEEELDIVCILVGPAAAEECIPFVGTVAAAVAGAPYIQSADTVPAVVFVVVAPAGAERGRIHSAVPAVSKQDFAPSA
jgi:hypothetical protein